MAKYGMFTEIWLEILKERDHLGDLRVNENMILEQVLEKLCEDVKRTELVMDTVQWRTIVDTTINLSNFLKARNFLTIIVSCLRTSCIMELVT
jgi:hypothetical protein